MQKKLIIGLPVRLFHWLLVILIFFAWGTAEFDHLDWHMKIGQTILALLVWRVLWGLFGSQSARFATFLASPTTVMNYIATMFDRTKPMSVGYNAFGGWAIMAMLFALLFQTATGLFANDDIITEAPLMHLVSKDVSDNLTELHEINFNVILALVVLHLAANLFYGLYKHQPLVRRMITGTQITDAPAPPAAPLWWAAVLLAVAGGLVWGAMNYVYFTRYFS